MTKSNCLRALALLGALLVTVPKGDAWADETDPEGWQFRVTPNVWAIGVDGTLGLGELPDGDVDIPFHDILDHLDFWLGGRAEAQKGKWLLYGDGLTTTLGVNEGFSPTFGPFDLGPVTVGPFNVGPGGRHQIGPFTFSKVIGPFTETVDLDVKLKLNILELGGAYRLGQWPIDSAGKEWSLDILLGGRYTGVEIEVSLDDQSASLFEEWVDPFAGVRVDVDLSPKWDLVVSADFGGFGVGSDFTWNAWGMFGYQWQENKRLTFGYRGLYQDFETGSGTNRFKWDQTLHGPVAGIEISF